jgi:hypothetical protein
VKWYSFISQRPGFKVFFVRVSGSGLRFYADGDAHNSSALFD